MAKCLITGSQGFIGQHLTCALRARGHDVYGCDLGHASDEYPFFANGDIEHPSYIRCDVADRWQLERALAVSQAEYVFHTAAEFGRYNGAAFVSQLWQSNVVGMRHLLDLQSGFDRSFRLIHFSSSEIYGDWPGLMAEDVPERYVMHPLGDYAISKAVNEQQIRNSMTQGGTESMIVRLFNIYGPGEAYSPYRSAICRFIYCALHGLPITVYRSHQRSWLYIDDLVRTLTAIPERFKPGEIYNLGHPESLSMISLAQLVCQITGADPALIRLQGPEPQTTRVKQVDITKACADLGHEVTVSVAQGITATAAWMRGTYHIQQPKEAS